VWHLRASVLVSVVATTTTKEEEQQTAQKDKTTHKGRKTFWPTQHLQLKSQQTRKLLTTNKTQQQNNNIKKNCQQKVSLRWRAILSNGGSTRYLVATNNSQVN